jgi:aconitate hydratase
LPGESAEAHRLSGLEVYDLLLPPSGLQPGGQLTVRATAGNAAPIEFPARVRIETPIELEYYRHGGVLHMVLRNMLRRSAPPAH